MTKTKTCAERIGEHMKGRLEAMRAALIHEQQKSDSDDDENDEDYEESLECLRESVLAVTPSIRMRIELSTGGPADGFYIYLDWETKEVMAGLYYFQDWFDGAERYLSNDELSLTVNRIRAVIETSENQRQCRLRTMKYRPAATDPVTAKRMCKFRRVR